MKIFISWSGTKSHSIALVLREWIPVVLPYAHAWVSSEDISKGSRWGSELATELETTNCGILCITPDNLREPWLNFEAGALSKAVKKAQVHPLLLGLSAKDFSGPLSQFQATEVNREEIKKFIRAINDNAGADCIPTEQLDRNFDICWFNLEQRLGTLLPKSAGRTPDRSVAKVEAGATEVSLSDEDMKALQVMVQANGERVFPQAIATVLNIHPERAKHIMEKLEGLKLLLVSHNYLHGTSWMLSRNGRAELVKRNLL